MPPASACVQHDLLVLLSSCHSLGAGCATGVLVHHWKAVCYCYGYLLPDALALGASVLLVGRSAAAPLLTPLATARFLARVVRYILLL